MVAQVIHAAGESSPGDLPPDTHAVALAAPDESALVQLEQRLIAAGVPHAAIREPDPPWANALMAIGLRPARRADVAWFVSNLPLLKGDAR
jgi:hypothetical protein